MFFSDCHGSVPDSWHMGETVGMRITNVYLLQLEKITDNKNIRTV